MRRPLVGWICLVLFAGVVAVAAPAAADPQVPPGDGGLGWQYSSHARGWHRQPDNPPSPPQPDSEGYWHKTEVDNPWMCGTVENCGDGFNGLVCDNERPIGDLWGPNRDRVAYAHSHLRRHDSWPANRWEWVNWECVAVGDEDWIDLDDEVIDVNFEIFQALKVPVPVFEPAPKGLVNLPVILSTDYPVGLADPPRVLVNTETHPVQVRVNFTIPEVGAPGYIEALGDFTWTFSDGNTAKGRGEKYTPAIDPRHDGGYYVKNTFRQTGPQTATLVVNWTGRVHVDLPGADVDEDIPGYSTPPQTAQFQVAEAKPVLGKR